MTGGYSDESQGSSTPGSCITLLHWIPAQFWLVLPALGGLCPKEQLWAICFPILSPCITWSTQFWDEEEPPGPQFLQRDPCLTWNTSLIFTLGFGWWIGRRRTQAISFNLASHASLPSPAHTLGLRREAKACTPQDNKLCVLAFRTPGLLSSSVTLISPPFWKTRPANPNKQHLKISCWLMQYCLLHSHNAYLCPK